jgi:putative DNA primase/helicase
VNLFRQLKSIDPKKFGLEPSGEHRQVPALHFSKDAQTFFNGWLTTLELRLQTKEFGSPVFEGHMAKYRSLMPSLALLFELVDMLDRNLPDSTVGLESAKRAAQWCSYLERHAQRVYLSAVQPEVQAAHELHKKLIAGKIKHETPVREIYRHHWSLLDTESKTRAGLAVLQSCNWLRIASVQQAKGAPSDVIRLHPLLKYSAAFGGAKNAGVTSTHPGTSVTSSQPQEEMAASSAPASQLRRSSGPRFLRLKPQPTPEVST